MNVLSLFSGIGGLELGLERAGMTVVGQVEIDPFCRRVLAKHWPEVPRHDDVRTAVEWWTHRARPDVHVVAGGFPCQPVSVAGQQRAQEDERWLWPAVPDIIRELRPDWVLLENVPGLLGRGLGDVLGDLAACGYDSEWDCVPASAVGAPHIRDRVFVVAHTRRFVADTQSQQGRDAPVRRVAVRQPGQVPPYAAGRRADVADADREGSSRRPGEEGRRSRSTRRVEPQRLGYVFAGRRPTPRGHWASEPDVGRVAHGVPARVDRLRALGNAVVPQVAEHVGRLVMGAAA